MIIVSTDDNTGIFRAIDTGQSHASCQYTNNHVLNVLGHYKYIVPDLWGN